MNEQSEHLSNAQIENYGDRAFDAGSGADHEAGQIEAHLDGCPSCRRRLLDFQRAHFALLPDPKFAISKDANLKDTDHKPTDAELSDAGLSDAKLSAPKLAGSKFVDPKFVDPKFEDPKFSDSKFADAKFIDPKFTDPKHLTDQQVNTASTPDCPSEDDLRQLSAGLLPDPVADKLTHHAATCDHCGPLLRAYTEDFSDDFSPEQQAVMANLQSSSAAWQKKTARQMIAAGISAVSANATGASAAVGTSAATAAASSASANAATTIAAATSTDATANPETTFSLPGTISLPNRKSSANTGQKTFFWRWAFPAATAACALIAFSIWFTQRDTPEKVEKLLAQAYTEQRTMEMRWPGAAWGPVRITRGPGDSRFAKPSSLLKAEGKIGEHSLSDPKNVEWLRAKAQADILERNPEAAVASLSQALEANPTSVALILDLSTAYYQQGEISLDPQNYEKSVDLLGQVLSKDPENLTALFNRALLNEQMKMVDSAIADWELFLQKEKDPGWIEDAQKRLAALQQLKRKKSSYHPPTTIEQWTAALNSDSPNVAEEAIDAAVVEWLPKAYPDHSPPENTALSYASLLALAARKLQLKHDDNWLADLLRYSSSPHFTRGISELTSAALLNSQGKASDAVAPASKAETLFRRDHNFAGLARAQLEEVYAYQRSGEGSACINRAANLRSILDNQQYLWIKIQLLLDEASCFNILGRLEEAKLDADDALAQNSGSATYKTLQLRILGIAAGLATTRGDRAFAVKQDLAGLQEYWSAQYPIIRAYQFYSDLSFNAEASELWHLTNAADKEAVWAILQTSNKQVEAVARYRLVKANIMLGEQQAADAEIIRADRIFTQLPKTESTLITQIDGIIGVIRSHINLGQYDAALSKFKQVNIPSEFTKSSLIARRMYQLSGDIELKLGNLKEAQVAYLAVINIAESSLTPLHDERTRLIWNQENGSSYRALADIWIKQGDPLTALEIWERYHAVSIQQKMLDSLRVSQNNKTGLFSANVTDFNIVQKAESRLNHETQLIYAVLPDGLAIWKVNESGIDFKFAKAKPIEIQRLARQFSEECSDPRSDLASLRTHGNQLYNSLIQPVAKDLPPGHVLIFEIDQELKRLPFAAVLDNSGKYLGETFPIGYSLGFAYRQHLRTNQRVHPSDFAIIIGSPAIGAKWRRLLPLLPSANTEAELVASKFIRPMILKDKNASLPKIRSAWGKAKIFEFAGHSIQTTSGASLVLAEDPHNLGNADFATLSKIPREELHSLQLVVLSACSTGVSKTNLSDSLVEPFLLAGVPNTVVTQWNVESDPALIYIGAFYDHILSGKTPSQAIQAAAKLLRNNPRLSHPYYWAAFVTIGNG